MKNNASGMIASEEQPLGFARPGFDERSQESSSQFHVEEWRFVPEVREGAVVRLATPRDSTQFHPQMTRAIQRLVTLALVAAAHCGVFVFLMADRPHLASAAPYGPLQLIQIPRPAAPQPALLRFPAPSLQRVRIELHKLGVIETAPVPAFAITIPAGDIPPSTSAPSGSAVDAVPIDVARLRALCTSADSGSSSLLQGDATITLLVHVTAGGEVSEARVIRSSGYSALDLAVSECLLKHRIVESTLEHGVAQSAWRRVSWITNR